MDDADPDPNFNLTNYIDNPNPNPVIYEKIPQPILPTRYPRHIATSRRVRERYDHLYGMYSQLRHLWHVQLKHHDEWSLRTAHELWWEHGPRTFEGRRLGWSPSSEGGRGRGRGNWLTEAMDACKAQIEELERSETARRMKRMRMVRRYTVDLLAPPLPRHTIPREKEVWMNLPYFDPSRKSGVGILPGTSRDVPIVVENEEEEEHVVDLLAFPELDLGEFEFVPQPEDQEKAERKEAGSNSSFVSASTSTLSSSSRKRALSEMERGGTNEDSAAKKPM